ncbi:MAG: LptA/OstA family protein [Deltaproteobacteria bacterium]
MNKAYKYVMAILLSCFVFVSTGVCSQDGGAKAEKLLIDKKEKIQIVADRLEGRYDKKEVLFIGNVLTKQGEKVITCDTLTITYKNATNNKGGAGTNPPDSGELERMDANGDVKFFYGSRMIAGQKAVFYQEEQKLVITGEPIMWDGDDFIRGNRIIFFYESNEGVVEKGEKQRVSAVIYPKGETAARDKK